MDELEGRMELEIELGEEIEEEEAHLYPAYRSKYGILNDSTHAIMEKLWDKWNAY